jgi:hypothetical protein
MAKFRSVAMGVYAGRCSSPWRAARSRAGVPSGGGDATGLEPGLVRVKIADVGSFPHLRTHTHRSTEVQRAVGGGAQLASTRVACDSVPACARKGAALRLGAGVHLARPQWRAKAGMQSHVTRHTTHDTTSRHHAACINGGLPERSCHGAGVRTSTTSPTPTHATQDRHGMTAGPPEPEVRWDARHMAWRCDAWWPSVRRSQVRLDAPSASAPGTAAWGCCVRG